MPSEPVADRPALSFDGRFSDGRTAASHRVRVAIDNRAITILRDGASEPLVWPLAGLETAEPIIGSAIDVLVHEPGRGGATLFVAEGAFARRLAEVAPHLTARAQRWRIARPWVWLTAAAAAFVALVTFVDLSPSRWIASLLPDKARVALGRQVIRSMGDGHAVCSDPAGTAALASLASRLSAATGSAKRFEVQVIDTGVINAFAAPGEQIVIMRGLIDKSESADEVAAVLAHEMGHGLELHPEASIVRVVGLTAITEFILGGSGGTIANVGLMLTQLGYTRQAEREADRHAVAILKNARISNRGFADFFRRMAKSEGVKTDAKTKPANSPFDLLRSHPTSAERLAAIEAAPAYPSVPALDVADWRALKSICGPPKPVKAAPRPPEPRRPSAPAPGKAPPAPAQRDI